MKVSQRLGEAIKQTEIALEGAEGSDTQQYLDQSLDSLERALESLE